MRNNSAGSSGTWATFVREGRERRGLSQEALARLVGVERTTVWRWENKNQKPDTPTLAAAVGRALAAERDEEAASQAEALRLAGYTVPTPMRDAPALPPEPELHRYARRIGLDMRRPAVAKILAGPFDGDMKRMMLDRELEWQMSAERQRADQIDFAAEIYRRTQPPPTQSTGQDEDGVDQAA